LIIRFDAVNAQENFVISLGRRVCCVPVLRSTPLTCTNLLSHAQTFSNACVWSNHTCASACTCQHARAHSRAHKRTTERFPKRYLSSSASSTFCILNPIRMRNESILSSARDFKRSAKSLNSYLGFEMCIPEVSNTTPSSCWNILEYHDFNSALRVCSHVCACAFVSTVKQLGTCVHGCRNEAGERRTQRKEERKWKEEERPTGRTCHLRIYQKPVRFTGFGIPTHRNFTVLGLVSAVVWKISGNRNTLQIFEFDPADPGKSDTRPKMISPLPSTRGKDRTQSERQPWCAGDEKIWGARWIRTTWPA
jgi:hypothetical protein